MYNVFMHRTQLYLEKKQLNFLKKKSTQNNTSVSNTIRELIDSEIQKEEANLTKNSNPFVGLAKLAEELQLEGPEDLSTNLDKYLYG